MLITWLDRLGDWNPQLLRELKGRFKGRNLLVTAAISLIAQGLTVLYFLGELDNKSSGYGRYCTGESRYDDVYRRCLVDAFGQNLYDWSLWWLDVFMFLSIAGMFVLLTVGVYLLVSDLDREQRRGTLNFIRLSPQAAGQVLGGKLMGVPALLYLVTLTTLPLHLKAGLSAGISLPLILGFYSVLAASGLCFFSGALLYGLTTTWLGGFQPWLGSGALFMFQLFAIRESISQGPQNWLQLFTPAITLPHLANQASSNYDSSFLPPALVNLTDVQFFTYPLATTLLPLMLAAVLNFALWSFWCWQAINRCFHSPEATILSKRQSYGVTACFNLALLGFAIQTPTDALYSNLPPYSDWLTRGLQYILALNLVLFLFLMAALTPQRQMLQDWARYRRERKADRRRLFNRSLLRDLVWGEKSPTLLALVLNLTIVTTLLLPWILVVWPLGTDKPRAVMSLILTFTMILFYGAIAQLAMMIAHPKRTIWAMAIVGLAVVLPIFSMAILDLSPEKAPAIWLLTAFPWAGVDELRLTSLALGVLAQWSMVVLATIRLNRQLRQAGQSQTKALMAGI